jgi:hypothetical protein
MESAEIPAQSHNVLRHPLYAARIAVEHVVGKFLEKTGDMLMGEPAFKFPEQTKPGSES